MKVDRAYLREWRLAKGLTQPELASRVGTVKSEISRLEKGSRRMTLDWMSVLSKALGIGVDDLMTPPPIGFGAVSAPPPQGRQEVRMQAAAPPTLPALFMPANSVSVTISGDDWSGQFQPGDLLIADRDRRSTGTPGLFAVEVDGERMVRRITPGEGGPVMTCANSHYPPVQLSDEHQIIGRVVARLHRL